MTPEISILKLARPDIVHDYDQREQGLAILRIVGCIRLPSMVAIRAESISIHWLILDSGPAIITVTYYVDRGVYPTLTMCREPCHDFAYLSTGLSCVYMVPLVAHAFH